MDKKEMKARKKAFKKAKRKAIRPWRFLTKFSLPFAIILIAATVITSMFDNTIALFVGGTFWELVNEDEMQFTTMEISQQKKKEMQQVQLLLNR